MGAEPVQRNKCKYVAVVLGVIALALAVAVVVIVVLFKGQECSDGGSVFDVSEPSEPGVFHDLTLSELRIVKEYLHSLSKFNFKGSSSPNQATHIYTAALYLPPKQSVLDHLDEEGSQPPREAKVILFRRDLPNPQVEEYIVGPLPNPTYCTLLVSPSRKNPVPYHVRPFSLAEIINMHGTLNLLDKEIGHILRESYHATFTKCATNCLTIIPAAVAPAILGNDERKMWLRTFRKIEQENLHPLDLNILVDTGSDNSSIVIDKVYYSGRIYNSLDHLKSEYKSSNISKTKLAFPEDNKNLFSTMNLRGDPVPSKPQAPPRLYEPNGRRFNVKHNHISYLNWEFDTGMSTLFGPRVYDVRFKGERIAYEIALQEIVVFYSGQNPAARISDFVDSVAGIGFRTFALTPGVDCPETAVFLPTHALYDLFPDPLKFERSICIFEQNSGFPLRRHFAYEPSAKMYYSGMADSFLVMRSIHAISNYDYIVDFIFHQSGAIEMKIGATGYIFSTFKVPGEEQYGFQLHDNVMGSFHQHLFHVKADLDILGTSNRYETIDITSETVDNEQTTGSKDQNYNQLRIDRKLKQTESEAAYKFNFDEPMYLRIYNNDKKTAHGQHRAYRIHSTGLHKQPLPANVGNEQSISWARYQLAFSKFKDDERESSSVYAMMDSVDPVVNFTQFIADDENLVDEDIVAWITLGVHHIPHTEDLPVTPTVGGHLGFFLLPHNYFAECPSMSSRDAIRSTPKDKLNVFGEYDVERNGNEAGYRCIP